MIFLAYSAHARVTYALFNGTLIRIPDNSGMQGQAFLHAIVAHANPMSTEDRCRAHYRPDCRELPWTWKVPYSGRRWGTFRNFGTVV